MTPALIIRETMSGWLKLDTDGREQPFAFSIRAVGGKLFALTAPRPFTGTVTLDGRDTPCEGEMTLHLTGPHYRLDFRHDTLGPLRVEGRKTFGKNGLLQSLVTCPLTVYRHGDAIGTAHVSYRAPMLTLPFTVLRLERVGPVVFPAGSIPYYGNQYGGQGGHYESWFLRANHPSRPLAFWVRYTQFIPADKRQALGEVWGIWFNGEKNTVTADGKYEFFDWTLETGDEKTRVEVHIHAPAPHFTALTYFNPPKGSKTCLNCKIARCTVKITEGGRVRELHSAHGAAFEILTDRQDHGVALSV